MASSAFAIGIVVGLTGMGGGALMTPVLVLFFNVPPLAAVSSDLVASAMMKPVGSAVHLRHQTVNLSLVKWLVIGSVPAAFCGVLVLKALGDDQSVQSNIQTALGLALLLTATLLVVRAYLRLVEKARNRDGRDQTRGGIPSSRTVPVRVSPRIVPTLLLGLVGGFIVGMTSVGSGSLIIVGLMLLYPGLKANQLVGTDLVQAVPLVLAAALGHYFFGDISMSVTLPLIIGSIPGVFLGAQLSSRLNGGLVRRALAFVLLASGLKMLGLENLTTGIILLAVLLVAPPLWMYMRTRLGFPAWHMKLPFRAAGNHPLTPKEGPDDD